MGQILDSSQELKSPDSVLNKGAYKTLLFVVVSFVFMAPQFIAWIIPTYLSRDWKNFLASARQVQAKIVSSNIENRREQRTDAAGHMITSIHVIYHLDVEVPELKRNFLIESSNFPPNVGQPITGYYSDKENQLRIESLNQNIPDEFFLHIAGFIVSCFLGVPIAIFFSLPFLIPPKLVQQFTEDTERKSRVG